MYFCEIISCECLVYSPSVIKYHCSVSLANNSVTYRSLQHLVSMTWTMIAHESLSLKTLPVAETSHENVNTIQRNVLKSVFSVIKMLTLKGPAFRGNEEVFDSFKNRNFMMCLELIKNVTPFKLTVLHGLITLG